MNSIRMTGATELRIFDGNGSMKMAKADRNVISDLAGFLHCGESDLLNSFVR